VCALVAGAGALLLALAARSLGPEAPWLVVLDAVALVPLFATGLAVQLPPHGGRSAALWMARAFGRLRVATELRASPWGRVAESTEASSAREAVDELRLLVLPRAAMPGVVGLEIGLSWSSTPVGWTATPEVLARVLDGTPAAAKLTREVRAGRIGPGRRSDERVAVMLPRAPTLASTL
jgi:hypothetical protein